MIEAAATSAAVAGVLGPAPSAPPPSSDAEDALYLTLALPTVPPRIRSSLRLVLLDLPLLLSFAAYGLSFLAGRFYRGPFAELTSSMRLEDRAARAMGAEGYERALRGYPPQFEAELDREITYYNRQCTEEDVTARDANDLVLPPDFAQDEAVDKMMTHGAVVLRNILSNDTAAELRNYVASRHEVWARDEMWYLEEIFNGDGRLSLGMGPEDHPVVARAMEEVGNHAGLRAMLEGLLGRDPAMVEMASFTALRGNKDQGIHADTKYFGSSVLYSRTFLTSYSLFVALQDTTASMGATTMCPGTHHCANADLQDICLDEDRPADGPAFEVSSNGLAGNDGGVLRRGDAAMWNQNVGHRGPLNLDPDANRIMLVFNFASRRQYEKGDNRVQGMGTYWYQRWNMWGHTYADLKDAASTMASWPRRALRALGLFKSSRQSWGLPWLEHWARQMATGMDGELGWFIEAMEELGWGSWIKGAESEDWEAYIEVLVLNVQERLATAYRLILGVYLMLGMATDISSRSVSGATPLGHPFAWLRRAIMAHSAVAFLGWILWGLLGRSHLMRRIDSGEVFWAPFPNTTMTTPVGKTALPERMDYLVGSRFDADFLAAYNRVLDYHPGNQRFNGILSRFSTMPLDVVLERFRRPVRGVVPRMLSQDAATGHWTLMDELQVREFVHRLTIERRSPHVRSLHSHLKTVLAESRFGTHRDTAMARIWTPAFVERWQKALFGADVPEDGALTVATGPTGSLRYVPRGMQAFQRLAVPFCSAARSLSAHGRTFVSGAPIVAGKDLPLEVGDRVNVGPDGDGYFSEAVVTSILHSGQATVQFVVGGESGTFPAGALHRYRPIVEGDEVEVVDEDEEEWTVARVTRVHPLAMFDVLYENGEKDIFVPRDELRQIDQRPVVILHDSTNVDALEEYDSIDTSNL